MALNFNTLQKTCPPWFRTPGAEDDVILGIMGRLVRNLRGHAFPGWSTAEGRRAVAGQLLPAVLAQPGFKTAYHAELSNLDYGCRRALLERRQLSPCMAARQDGCHVIINRKQDTVVMLNEEEHLAIHHFSNKPDFAALLTGLYQLPRNLENRFDFAADSRNGYLTSLPGESGEGVQLYTVLHLPALTLSNMMPQVTRSIDKLQLNIAPFYPQYGEECGNIYVLYTAPVIYGVMEEMITHLNDVMYTLVEREHQVRDRLLDLHDTGDLLLADSVNRSYGLLRYARAITLAEWVDAISMLRLGVVCGFVQPTEGTEQQLLTELAAQLLYGGDFADGNDIPEPPHPRAATEPQKARSRAIQSILNRTTLLTAPCSA
ncbi:MAG: hypothetical protein IJ503_04215 [Akkermansia sp.]|nr:hypothetical protein [Akkermansia sp.]